MQPTLKLRSQFEKILNSYTISDEGRQILKDTQLALLSSPTSAGRNTLIRQLVKTGKYEFIVSDTTRPKRQNNGVWEKDGVEYFFRNEADFLQDLRNGLFLEAELIHNQQVSGISLRELKKATQNDKIAINEVDFEGIDNIVQAKPDTVAVLVLPPNFDSWMQRLRKRGEMSPAEFTNRMVTARKFLESARSRSYYKILINDDLTQAADKLQAIIEKDDYSEIDHTQGLQVADKLLEYVKNQLASLSN